MEEEQNLTQSQNPVPQPIVLQASEKITEVKPRFPKKIIAVAIGVIIILACIVFALLNYKNFISSCTVTWASFPKVIYPNTNYTVYINKVSTTHKWRDVSVFKDLDIQNSNAYRESGLTGDAYNQPSNTYTLTFNSGEVGTHKLYFYNNDFKSYGEASGTGPRTLCDPVFTFVTSNIVSAPTPTVSTDLVGSIFWNVASSSATPNNELNDIKNAFSTLNTNGDFLGVESINISSISANFAIASMSKRDMNNVLIPTDGFEYLLYKNNLIWEILPQNDSSFCSTLKLAPADILTDSRKTYYSACFQ